MVVVGNVGLDGVGVTKGKVAEGALSVTGWIKGLIS